MPGRGYRSRKSATSDTLNLTDQKGQQIRVLLSVLGSIQYTK